MPKMTVRENETINRFKNYNEAIGLLRNFFDKGFKSFPALKAIVLHYHPDVDVDKLKRLWNLNSVDEDVKMKLLDVYDKLKSE